MTDLTVPASAADADMSTSATLAAELVRILARQHRVAYEPTPLDAFAAEVSRLSDAEVVPDAVEDLLQALTRAGVVTHCERFALHAAYPRELQTIRPE